MSTWIIGGLVALAAVLAARSIYKDKKAGKHSCGGNCGACGMCSGPADPSQIHSAEEER